jgi:hypothetical protein
MTHSKALIILPSLRKNDKQGRMEDVPLCILSMHIDNTDQQNVLLVPAPKYLGVSTTS